jgi:hypothetical protein
MSDPDSGFLIRALSFPNESDRIRIYQEVFRGYHRDLRARIEVPQVRNSFQERGDRISKRFEEARVQIQLQSLTRTFEKVAEARRQKEEQETLQRVSKSFQEREDRIIKLFEEFRAEAVGRPRKFPKSI